MVMSAVLMPLLLALDALRVLGAPLAMPTALSALPIRRVSMVLPLLVALAKLLPVSLAPRTAPLVPVLLTALLLLPLPCRLLLSPTTSLLVCMVPPILLALVMLLLPTSLTHSVSLLVRPVMLSVLATLMVPSLVVFATTLYVRLVAKVELSHPALASRAQLVVTLGTHAQSSWLPHLLVT